MIWLFIVIGIILFITLILVSKLYIKIDYLHAQDNDQLSIMARLWFIRYTFNIPLIRIDKDSKSLVFAHDEHVGNAKQEPQQKSKEILPKDILNRFKDTKELLQHVVHLHSIVKKFLKKISIHKLEWHTNFGIGDAASTGVFVGAGWSIKGSILGIVSQYMSLKTKPNITITPFFQHTFSHTKLTCMISFRIGNAILAGLRIVKFWKGGRPSFTGGPSFLKSKNTEKSIS
jgi:hypothetical protein